jgi:hypothetical protein
VRIHNIAAEVRTLKMVAALLEVPAILSMLATSASIAGMQVKK